MVLNELINFFKKKGFHDVYQVLTKFKNYKTELHTFYKELNKFSYYNAFLRVKNKLIERNLISIEKHNEKKFISLTEKGINVYNKLVEVNNIIKKDKTRD